MNKTKIEWCDYTWNPVVGCKNGCSYCYAKRMNDRFKWIKNWDEPKFFKERLKRPYLLKKPSKIFVCSIADLFGEWVDRNWIEMIIGMAMMCPHHTFQFLTKNPKRYLEFEFPKNCWLGITIDGTEEVAEQEGKIRTLEMKSNYKFISFEPLLGYVVNTNLFNINQVIVGAMTGPGAIKPEKEWIDSIKHPNIFYKDNIKKFLTKQ